MQLRSACLHSNFRAVAKTYHSFRKSSEGCAKKKKMDKEENKNKNLSRPHCCIYLHVSVNDRRFVQPGRVQVVKSLGHSQGDSDSSLRVKPLPPRPGGEDVLQAPVAHVGVHQTPSLLPVHTGTHASKKENKTICRYRRTAVDTVAMLPLYTRIDSAGMHAPDKSPALHIAATGSAPDTAALVNPVYVPSDFPSVTRIAGRRHYYGGPY